jgi:hypothetical protein
MGATKQTMLEEAERENHYQTEKWLEYLDTKTWKKMRKLASNFSVNEINWIANYVKKLTIAEETHPDKIQYKAPDVLGKAGMITSNCYTAEETLIELKIRYGRFLDNDYSRKDVEPYMDSNWLELYESTREELETKID